MDFLNPLTRKLYNQPTRSKKTSSQNQQNPKPPNQNKLGKLGENRAKKYLQSKGWLFITQNYSTRFGELDLIFLNGSTVVFIEVKTRESTRSGTPEEAVTRRKLHNLRKAAEIFLTKNERYQVSAVRIDVIAIENDDIRHYEGVY